jgi:hypothetical protein
VTLFAAYMRSLRITRWDLRPAGRAVVFLFVAVNISEAVVAEALQKGYVNALVGVALIATLALPSTVRIDRASPLQDLVYPLGGLWVACYTVWNFTFVYGRASHGQYSLYAALAVIHLGSSLLAMRGRSDLYMESRATTLSIAGAVRLCFPWPPLFYRSEGWFVKELEWALCAVGALLASVLVWQSITKSRRGIAPTDSLGRLAVAVAPPRVAVVS